MPWPGDDALILQNEDGRVVFVLPYEGAFSLIGTTDVPFTGDPAHVAIDDAEIDYLIAAVGRYLARPIARADVVGLSLGTTIVLGSAPSIVCLSEPSGSASPSR